MNTTTPIDSVHTHIPASLARLSELPRILWWSWTVEARQLFEAIDPTLWFYTHHNPVKLLADVKPERLAKLADDPSYLRQYSAVLKLFDEYRPTGEVGSARTTPRKPRKSSPTFPPNSAFIPPFPFIAAVSASWREIIAKRRAILGVPLVGIGFMYPQGYFRQRITPEGWQEAAYAPFNREDSPIHPALTPSGEPCRFTVDMGGRNVTAVVWKVLVGRIPLYLIDTDVPENSPENRALSARLYGGDQEMRLCQEILLGIGGVRLLRALGIAPAVWHANEGHSAFLTLERVREMVQRGRSHAEASELVRQSTVFTTHTPVPAGHDVFPHHLMDRYFSGYWEQLGLSRDEFLRLGETPESRGHGFNMTALVMRLSAHVNGVSREHGRVSREMWQHFWPGLPVEPGADPAV